MITYVEGDLFQSPAKVLVNTVNTVGVMGKGIAGNFRRIYPEMFRQYQTLCEKGQLDIGKLWLWKTSHKWILNFPTKRDWRQASRPEYIQAGLEKFVTTYADKGINSISFPQLGCGNGELDWQTQVRPLMEQYLAPLPITIFIHLYEMKNFVPEHRVPESTHAWLQGEPYTMAFVEFWADLENLIKSKRKFKTLDTESAFCVTLTANPDGIDIEPENGRAIFIPKEDDGFLDLWQYIRVAGYCMPDKLPVGLDEHASYIVGLLSELDYLHEVRLSRTDDRQQIGLQLIPPTRIKRHTSETSPHAITLT
jgi:O-acetyl-ADP-ribose deacetylase (regulator of RNase III)